MNMRIFLIAGEASGDQLGAGLMRALRLARPDVEFCGIGGPAMQRAGLTSLFPLADLAVMGFLPVLRHLPRLLKRIEEAAIAVRAARPAALVIIDSPDFTHRVARRVRRQMPDLPIIDYVSPTVWAWRSGRARSMRAYIDHVLALLPFEPEAYRRLAGPPCSYVGHPLIERRDALMPSAVDLQCRNQDKPLIVVLPGSRRSEITRLMPIFGQSLALLAARIGAFDCVLPAVPHLEAEIRDRLTQWPIKPRLISDEVEKFACFRRATAALAASGTVTLELALAMVPMVVAYKVSPLESLARFFIEVPSIVLPNLIFSANAIPEFLQENCNPVALADALAELCRDSPARRAETEAFVQIAERLNLPAGETPSGRAAHIVLAAIAGAKHAGAC
jgi:lipid-A-disaccharide synthase